MIKFPYGISDFYQVITEDYFYVDRTKHIRLIEEYGKNLLFLRPRRFGKSLLTSMLENYYDVNKANEFDKLFGHLAIGKKPTPRRNQYLVMRWDFSLVKASRTTEQMESALHDNINGAIEQFMARYETLIEYQIQLHPTNALRSFQSLLAAVQRSPYPLYLLIDEYDNFANAVLMGGSTRNQERYEALVEGEGALKTIFKGVKAATTGLGLDRLFITGVSPVVMSDITSAQNISKQISLEPAFGDLCGFWEREIEVPLRQIVSDCGLPEEKVAEALADMRTFYDGYAFYEEGELIYNPTLVLYFLDYYQRHCTAPRNMLDGNFAMDRAKIAYVASLPNGRELIEAAVEEKEPIAIYQLEQRFGIAEMLSENHDADFFASLLYYLGVLTLGGINKYGELILKIPNLVVRKLYLEHLQKSLLPGKQRGMARKAAKRLYKSGLIAPLCDFIEQHYFKVFDNRDYFDASELTIKTIFLTLLFNDTIYIMDSEKPLQRGYADLTMIVRPQMRQYQLLDILIEFKYVKLGEAGVTGDQVKKMSRSEVAALKAVNQKRIEAISQAKKYRQRLETKYGDTLRLRTYVVVALGFERLVWQEVAQESKPTAIK